ncbi:hypothetical protein DICA1_E07338 [Diutina catenulata]
MIEDKSGRVMYGYEVLGAEQLVTGCTVAVHGVAGKWGFEVLEMVHPQPIASRTWKAIADGDTASILRLEVLKQYVLGETGDPHRTWLIAEVVVGDSIAAKHEVVTDSFSSSNNNGSKIP